MVLVDEGSAAPHPTSVIRLLVTSGRAILVVPRADGRGLDIPTSVVDDDVESTLQKLHESVLRAARPRLVGFVRNMLDTTPEDYPWPVPVAHFAVCHCEAPRGVKRRGEWLDLGEAEDHLGARHWWPLLRQLRFDVRN